MRRIISLKYGAITSRETLCAVLNRLLGNRSLNLILSQDRREALISADQLRQAPHVIEVDDKVVLADFELPLLSQGTIDLLTREVDYIVLEYANITHTLHATVTLSRANDFPVLGSGIWLDSSLDLPAGFVTLVAADNHAEAELHRILQDIGSIRF